VRKAPCADLAELRSAFVDGALDNPDRERLLSHLVDCAHCRQDVEDLRAVRMLLKRSNSEPGPASSDLSSRLVSIAGPESIAPLWTRPFRRIQPSHPFRTGGLPSHRRIVKLRIAAATMALGATVTAIGIIGYAAAPRLAAIDDPTAEAQAAFTSSLGQFPLASDALNAVMLANSGELSASISRRVEGPSVPPGITLTPAEARVMMQKAADAGDSVSYSGRQSFLAYRDGRAIVAQVDVDARARQGTQVRVISQRGQQLLSGFTAALISSRVVDVELLDLLERNYDLSGTSGANVAGRSASVVTATREGNSSAAARWWIDDATGIVLWKETYDRSGSVDLSAGFTSVSISHGESILEHLPPKLAVPRISTSLTISSAAELKASGWSCVRKLAGLSLVRIRSDRANNPDIVHLVYSDGLNTASVFQQRGQLSGAPEGSQWDAGLGAYVRRGASSVATWQAAEMVLTVVTDGNPVLLEEAVESLPHERIIPQTTLDRIEAGWARILADVKG
jgi:negative regulator of sigma E activity/anti-sigma factor RsiW